MIRHNWSLAKQCTPWHRTSQQLLWVCSVCTSMGALLRIIQSRIYLFLLLLLCVKKGKLMRNANKILNQGNLYDDDDNNNNNNTNNNADHVAPSICKFATNFIDKRRAFSRCSSLTKSYLSLRSKKNKIYTPTMKHSL
jgi:hypothetical protein